MAKRREPSKLKQEWMTASQKLAEAGYKGLKPAALKAARKRERKAHNSYWTAVRRALREHYKKGTTIEYLAEKHDVEFGDMMSLYDTPDPPDIAAELDKE